MYADWRYMFGMSYMNMVMGSSELCFDIYVYIYRILIPHVYPYSCYHS